jgi:FMN phosphatase YigB (HAD superfamily)
MAIKAVTFDAYGTLLGNEDLTLIPRRIVADHGLATRVEDVWRVWIDLYLEVTQTPPFRTLREIQAQILARVLRRLGVDADPARTSTCSFGSRRGRSSIPKRSTS